ncbi:antibiotic biosynthesis monooxygenase family protein [Rhodococcus sp. (in: high G+C Gram-positive bacteria)]|uniref:antibiotic biosynthesis monooxygenase family protein n=1 Tax=Rhodococcus sp. TaxID=1831 RepID=UPI00388F9066
MESCARCFASRSPLTAQISPTADTAKAFEKVFADSMRKTLDGVPGLNRTTLLRPAAEGLPYLSTMEFDSKDDFLAWLRSDSFKAAHSDDQAPGMQAPSAVEQHTLVEDIVSEK